jgi:hypothetical protein
MTHTLSKLCTPRHTVFERDRRAEVLNLDNFLDEKIKGEDFFRENYFTTGMATLVERALRHLGGGQAESSVFQLSQAMGGGKTHSMISLGLLARDPALRKKILGDKDPAPQLGKVKVVGYNGRKTDYPLGIWGYIAEQLGRKDQFKAYYQPLSAPGPQAWKELLLGQPTIILLDELPPYMDNARSVAIGNADLSVVTTTALSNLLVAVSEMDSVCVIISDLGGGNYQQGSDLLQKSLSNLKNETKRIAVPITPVNPQGDELFHILRCRLFDKLPDETVIAQIASGYRQSHADAVKVGLTSTSSDAVYQQCVDSYPFHYSWRELVGRFKENEGFQQTRGVIRLMQMVVANLWNTKRHDKRSMIHPYDLDLNDPEIGSEIRAINPSLSEAIAHDISHQGNAEAEQVDHKNGNQDATDVSRLILLASLSTTAGSIAGLREFELYNYLQCPGRDLSSIKNSVLDVLDLRAWYLHRSQDERLFYKNQQNLAAKLRSTAQGLHEQTVGKELRKFLTDRFEPSVRDLYQNLRVMPAFDEVQLELDKVSLVLAEPSGGTNGLPLSAEWQAWWQQQNFKNRIIFLTGSKMVMRSVQDSARQYRALQAIEDELRAENTPSNDPQWKALDSLKDRILIQFTASLTQAFDSVVYPSMNGALRSSSINLEFKGNAWNGEEALRKTLQDAQKFTVDVTSEVFRQKAEQRLFPSQSQTAQWQEIKREAATKTEWSFHAPRALDDLKARCIDRDFWREEGAYVRRGPFPKQNTSVSVKVSSISESGIHYLRIEPLHGDKVYFEKGNNNPTEASSLVENCQMFEAKGLRYRFLCVDSQGQHPTGDVKEWLGSLKLKYEFDSQTRKVTLKSSPAGEIRYSTDGSSPEHGAIYDSSFKVPDKCVVVLAYAESEGIRSEEVKIDIPPLGEKTQFQVDHKSPCAWTRYHKLDDNGAVWAFVDRITKCKGIVHDLSLDAESASGEQTLSFSGSLPAGYTDEQLKNILNQMTALTGSGSLRLQCQRIEFAVGQNLLDWIHETDVPLVASEVKQG